MNMKKLLRYAFIPLIAVSILGCPLAIQRGDNEAQTLVDANGLPITVLKKDYNDGTGYTVTKNPLFEQRNSSDPALYVTHQMDVEKDVLMMVTSCDLNTANNPGGTYPMDKTYLYVTSTQEDPMLKWYDHGAILQESDLPWADNLDCVWAPDLDWDSNSNKFYLYVPAKTGSVQKIGIATANKTGTGLYDTFTALPEPFNIKGSPPNGGFSYDPGVFYDNWHGKWYMSYCDGNYDSGRINIVEMDSMTSGNYIGRITFQNDPGVQNPASNMYMEGPDICILRNESNTESYYYLQFAAKANSSETEYIGYAIATAAEFDTDPAGCWHFKGWIMKKTQNNEWTNHADLVEYGGRHFIFYHAVFDPNNKFRQVCCEQIIINDDGTIDGVTPPPSGQPTGGTSLQQSSGPFRSLGGGSAPPSRYIVYNDENINAGNNAKVKISLKNTTEAPLSNFKAFYFFTVENGKTPQVDDFSTPNANVFLKHIGAKNWAVVLNYAGKTLNPGETVSDDTFVLRYTDWSAFDKSNDFSQPGGSYQTSTFQLGLYNANYELVGGAIPPDVTETSFLKNQYAGKLLTVTGNTDNANVVCQGLNTDWTSQDWVPEKVSGNIIRMKNLWSGKYLAVTGSNDCAGVACQNLIPQWDSQKWAVEPAGNGSVRLKNVWSGKYLTVTGTNEYASVLAQNLNTGWTSQQWWFQ